MVYRSLESKLREGDYQGITIRELWQRNNSEFSLMIWNGKIILPRAEVDELVKDPIRPLSEEDAEAMAEHFLQNEIDEEMNSRSDLYHSNGAYQNPYYNDSLDLDQQSEDFWNEIG